MSHKDDSFNDQTNIGNTIDTGTKSVIQYTQEEQVSENNASGIIDTNQNPINQGLNIAQRKDNDEESDNFQLHDQNKSSNSSEILTLSTKSHNILQTAKTADTNILTFKLKEEDDEQSKECMLLNMHTLNNFDDISFEHSDGQNEEVLRSCGGDKNKFNNICLDLNITTLNQFVQPTIDVEHQPNVSNPPTTQIIVEETAPIKELSIIDHLVSALNSVYSALEDAQARYRTDKLIKYLEDVQAGRYGNTQEGITAKLELLMNIGLHIPDEPVAQAVETNQQEKENEEQKALLGTYTSKNHLSSLGDTRKRKMSITSSTNFSLADANAMELTTSEGTRMLTGIEIPQIEDSISDDISEIANRAKEVADIFSNIIQSQCTVSDQKQVWEYLLARIILSSAIKIMPLSLNIAQKLIDNPLALSMAWDMGRDAVYPIYLSSQDKQLDTFQDEIVIDQDGNVNILSSRKLEAIEINNPQKFTIPFTITKIQKGGLRDQNTERKSYILDQMNDQQHDSPEMLYRTVPDEKNKNQQKTNLLQSTGKEIFSSENKNLNQPLTSPIPHSSTTADTQLREGDDDHVIGELGPNENFSRINPTVPQLPDSTDSEGSETNNFRSGNVNIYSVRDDTGNPDNITLEQKILKKNKQQDLKVITQEKFKALYSPVYKQKHICILSQDIQQKIIVQKPENVTNLIYIGQQSTLADSQRRESKDGENQPVLLKDSFYSKFSGFIGIETLHLNNCAMPDISKMCNLVTLCLQNVRGINPLLLGNQQTLRHLYIEKCSFMTQKQQILPIVEGQEPSYDINTTLQKLTSLRHLQIIESALPQIVFIDVSMRALQTLVLRQNKGLCLVVIDVFSADLGALEFLQVDVITKFTRTNNPLGALLYAKTSNIQRPGDVKKIHKMYLELQKIIQDTKQQNIEYYISQFKDVIEKCEELLQKKQGNNSKDTKNNNVEPQDSLYKFRTLILFLYDLFFLEYRKTFEYIMLKVIEELLLLLHLPKEEQDEYCRKNLPLITSEGRAVFFGLLIYKWITQIQFVTSEWDMHANMLIAKVRSYKEQNRDFDLKFTAKPNWIRGFFNNVDNQLCTLHLCKPCQYSFVDAIEVGNMKTYTTRLSSNQKDSKNTTQKIEMSGSTRASLSKSEQSQSFQDSVDENYLSKFEKHYINAFDDEQLYDILVHDADGDHNNIQLPTRIRSFFQLGRGERQRSGWWQDPFGYYNEYKNRPISLGQQIDLITVSLYKCPYPSLKECPNIQNLSLSYVYQVNLHEIANLSQLKRIFINQIYCGKKPSYLPISRTPSNLQSIQQKINSDCKNDICKINSILDVIRDKKNLQFLFLKKCNLPDYIYVDWDIKELKILDIEQDKISDEPILEFDMNKCTANNLLFVTSPYKVLFYGLNPIPNLVHVSSNNTLRLSRLRYAGTYGNEAHINQYVFLQRRQGTPLYDSIERINDHFLGKLPAPANKINIYTLVNELWHAMQLDRSIEKRFYLAKCAMMIELLTDDWLSEQYQSVPATAVTSQVFETQIAGDKKSLQPFQAIERQIIAESTKVEKENNDQTDNNVINVNNNVNLNNIQAQEQKKRCIDFADTILKPVISQWTLQTRADLGAFHFMRTMGAYFMSLNIDLNLVKEIYSKPTALAAALPGKQTCSVTDVILAIDSGVCIDPKTKFPNETILVNEVGEGHQARFYDISKGDHKNFVPSLDVKYQLLIVRDKESQLEFGYGTNMQQTGQDQQQSGIDTMQTLKRQPIPINLQSLTYIGNKQAKQGLIKVNFPLCNPQTLINLVLYDCVCFDLSQFKNIRTFIARNVHLPNGKIYDWLIGMTGLQKIQLQSIQPIKDDISKDQNTKQVEVQNSKSEAETNDNGQYSSTFLGDQIIYASSQLKYLQWFSISECEMSSSITLSEKMSNLEYLSITKTSLSVILIDLEQCQLDELTYLNVSQSNLVISGIPASSQVPKNKSKQVKTLLSQTSSQSAIDEQLDSSLGPSCSGEPVTVGGRSPHEYVPRLCFLQCRNTRARELLCPALCLDATDTL